MEAVIGVKTVAQIAREYSVHPVQVSQWKAVIRDRLPECSQRSTQPFAETLHIIWRQPRWRLSRFRLQRCLLCLHPRDRVLVHNR